MITTIRIFRILVGLIAIWQIIGLMPILTWIQNLQDVTGAIRAIAFIKFLVLFFCGGIYFWLGKLRNRFNDSEKNISVGRPIKPQSRFDISTSSSSLGFDKKNKQPAATVIPITTDDKTDALAEEIFYKKIETENKELAQENLFVSELLEQGCSKEAIDYLKNPIHIYSYMLKYKKKEENIFEAIKKGRLRGCYVGEALWVENKKI